ncbi:MAG: DegT/DnrJ/EryC1/StrS family aminotransferase [Ignavibacteria bacterium]
MNFYTNTIKSKTYPIPVDVPFVDLRIQYESIKGEILTEINEVLNNTAYISGKKVKRFEEGFSNIHEVKHCVALSSGTDALHTALKAIDIKTDDEVIVPVNTFIATSASVSLCGAKPVFVDNDEKTYNIDVNKIEKAITKKTRAIIPVHLYGQPAEIEPILEIANKYSLTVIEDCSQAHISEYKNRKVGNFGSVGTFSFYPGKNLGAYGEGGAVVTNDSELYEKMLRFRQHGSTEKYIHDSEGANYRMEEIQAGVLNVKLKYITGWTEDRGKIASLYSKKLSDTDIIMPFCPPHIKHVYHLYIIRAKKRNQLQKYLSEKGIQTLLHYPMPLHLQKAYDYLKYKNGDFPAAEKCCSEILSLPMFPELTDQQIDYVCDSVRSFYN